MFDSRTDEVALLHSSKTAMEPNQPLHSACRKLFHVGGVGGKVAVA
jgi:hypothetical protein